MEEMNNIPDELRGCAEAARSSKTFEKFLSEVATDDHFKEYRNPILDYWRKNLFTPLYDRSKVYVSSDPIRLEKGLDNKLYGEMSREELANMSVKKKAELVNGVEWADDYEKMIKSPFQNVYSFYLMAIEMG